MILFQKEMDQLIVKAAVRLIAHGKVYPGFFVYNALVVGKCLEPVFSVVRAHSAFAKAAESHFARGKMNDGIINASAAKPAL